MKNKFSVVAILILSLIFSTTGCNSTSDAVDSTISDSKPKFNISDIYGKYTLVDRLYTVNNMVVCPTDYTNAVLEIAQYTITIHKEYPIFQSYVVTPEYDVIKINDDMLGNGLFSQGAALQGGIMSMQAREKITEDCYAIFPGKPYVEDMYPLTEEMVFYQIEDTLYLFFKHGIYSLEKL